MKSDFRNSIFARKALHLSHNDCAVMAVTCMVQVHHQCGQKADYQASRQLPESTAYPTAWKK